MGVPVSGGRQGWEDGHFYWSRKRDVNAAKAFLRKAMRGQRIPKKIMLDAYAASHRAVTDLKGTGELPKRVRVRTSKYLNNAIEQDHRRIKQRLRPMLGLKSFQTAAVVIGRIELAEKIKKGTVQTRQAERPDGNDARNLASCLGCLSRIILYREGTARPNQASS